MKTQLVENGGRSPGYVFQAAPAGGAQDAAARRGSRADRPDTPPGQGDPA